jgi:hypothetical protein
MLDAYQTKTVAQNIRLFDIKEVKCKQNSILTSKQNTK